MAICAAFLAALIVAGCAGNENNGPAATSGGPGPAVSALWGTWKYTSATVNGNFQPLQTALDWEANSVAATKLFSQSLYEYAEQDNTGGVTYMDSGTISASSSSVTIITNMINGTPVTPDVSTATWSVSGTILTLTFNEAGQVTVFTLIKN